MDREPREEYSVKESRKSRLPIVEQDKALAELQEAVNVLLDRLQPVLTPSEPTDKASDGERAIPVQSELASTLGDNNARIYRITRRVNNALERLEV